MAMMSKMASAPAPRASIDLVGVEDEVLAEHRGCAALTSEMSGGGFHLDDVIQFALEPRVGEYRDCGRTVSRVGPGQVNRVEIGPEQAAGGRGLFDLGNQPYTTGFESVGQAKRARLGCNFVSQSLQGYGKLLLGKFRWSWRRLFHRGCLAYQ